MRDSLKEKVQHAGGNVEFTEPAATYTPAATMDELVEQGQAFELNINTDENPDILSLKSTLLYGVKGLAAYADHAKVLGREDDVVYAFIQEALAAMSAE